MKTTYQSNEAGTFYYEISQFQDESTLRAKLNFKTFTQIEKLNIVLDVAKALKEAHAKSVYHRNVCPENIYVYEGGNAALANFGLAWFVEHTDYSFTVMANINLKSPYCAPELLDNDVCSGSDLYSLGVVFYELMVGTVPFESVATFKLVMGGVLPEDLLPSKVMKDLPDWMDEVVKHTIVTDLNERWQDADEFITFINALKLEPAPSNPIDPVSRPISYLKPGMKVSPSLTLYEELGKGGFGRVFKVLHDIENQFLAIKIFEKNASINHVISEYKALQDLNHPNIVELKYVDRTVPDGFPYTLMELLEGDNLQTYTNGHLFLPIDEVYKMADQILDALEYMQGKVPPIFHRDVKPSNIVWHKKQTFKLIDFNIASSTNNKSFAGTFPYLPPDLVQSGNIIEWDCSADTFALGITIYELLTHVYPWEGSSHCPNIRKLPTDIRKHNDKLSDKMAEFIMKSITTDRNKRYRTAKEMHEALMDIGSDGMLKDTRIIIPVTIQDTIDPVDYLNSLYSQSRHGNSGTRAGIKIQALDDLTYTETLLDKKLINDILSLKYKLIIITGNAGDGKTAFIHRIENNGTDKVASNSNNGSEFYISGLKFRTNYDGSQDEAEKANDMVLEDFFSPFRGLSDYTKATEGRVIAINEGRLVDFLSTHNEFRKLQDNIEDYFYKEGHTELMPGLMVINLNLRSVTATTSESSSLLAQQVKKLTRSEMWGKCGGCPIADRCFIKYNVDTFQDTSAGDEVINRLEWLLRTIIYKRELHITMRDLRSMISWMLTRDCSCDEVKQLVEYNKTASNPEYYWKYYYFNLTDPETNVIFKEESNSESYMPPTLYSEDRLIKLLRETDIAGVALPAYDRDLYFTDKVQENYLTFGDRKRSLLEEFNNAHDIVPAYKNKEDDERMGFVRHHKSFIRHQYFEGNIDFRRRLPYRFASKFEEIIRNEDAKSLEKTKQSIASAISASEGCDNAELTKGYLLLSNSNAKDPISKSYRRFPLDEFELFVNKTENLAKYIEYESDSLIFRHKKDKFIQLTVSLDLYEMLQYIEEGFSPSVNDLRGRFIELQIFKNLLEAKTYEEILVTKNNKTFTAIRLDENKHIVLEPLNVH